MLRGRSEVLVIGAGPAGCAAGIEAARRGARVTVVDRARFPRPKTCGDAVSNDAAMEIDRLGGGEPFARAPRAVVTGAAAVFPDGSRVTRSYGARPGYICARDDLDHALLRALGGSGAEVIEGVGVRELTTSQGRIDGARGDDFDWSADVVIAADGPGSLAWTALGRVPPRGAGLGIASTAYYQDLNDAEEPGVSEHYFRKDLPCGYAWIFPPIEGRANIGVYQRVDRYRAATKRLRSLLADFIADHAERFQGAEQRGAVRSWALPLATLHPPPSGPGVLSCGDAGRLIDPLTGEGIWQALRSGAVAARAAVDALGQRGFDGAAARRYRLACAREVGWPSAAHVAIQRGMETIVDLDLYRFGAVRSALEWGYRSRSLELHKSAGA